MERALLAAIPKAEATVRRAAVVEVRADGLIVEWGLHRLACDLLATSEGDPVRIQRGDTVLVCMPEEAERGIVLGRIGPSSAPAPEPERAEAGGSPVPDELVIEARKNLTLRVGEGSITLREDGKILIRGKDLVSHARRMNRIRGGAVAIN